MRQIGNVLLLVHPEGIATPWPPGVDVAVEVGPDRMMADGGEVVALKVWQVEGQSRTLVRSESLPVEPVDTLAARVQDAVEAAVVLETSPVMRAIRQGVRNMQL